MVIERIFFYVENPEFGDHKIIQQNSLTVKKLSYMYFILNIMVSSANLGYTGGSCSL